MKIFTVFWTLWVGLSLNPFTWPALAHEKTFPTKQLAALTPEGLSVSFKELSVRPESTKLKQFEKDFELVFSKGELAGNLFLGTGEDKKTQLVVVFLDGKSERGDTEFGAAINNKGRVAKVIVFSSPEPAASKEFLSTFIDKNASELQKMRQEMAGDPSKKFLTELTLKAVGRVSSSFK